VDVVKKRQYSSSPEDIVIPEYYKEQMEAARGEK